MLKKFSGEDFDAYLALSREFYASAATDHPVPETHFQRTFQETVGGSPLARGWLIYDHGRPAGYILAALTWSTEFGGRVAWLDELYLRPESRGRGLGRGALERAMEELSRQDKVAGFRLEVAPANAGVGGLYERLGFRPAPYEPWDLFL